MSHKSMYTVLMKTNKTETGIVVAAKSKQSEYRWAFVRSITGQLDYKGKVEQNEDSPLFSGPVTFALDASPFFSASWYTWLPDTIPSRFSIEVRGENNMPDSDMFAYLTHIGALLGAVESGDSLLAAEIFNRRDMVFMKFPPLTMTILEPIAVEGLFSWVWARFYSEEIEALAHMMAGKNVTPQSEWGVVEAFYTAGKDRLYPSQLEPEDFDTKGNSISPCNETPEQMMIRYFKKHRQTKLTVGLVGTEFNSWSQNSLNYIIQRVTKEETRNLVINEPTSQNLRDKLFSDMAVSVQAEPYNVHDKNAVAIYLEDLAGRASGNYGTVRAGYLRRYGAALVRNAKPHRYNFNGKLSRIGNSIDGRLGIVVEMVI